MDFQEVCHNYSFASVRCIPAMDRRGFDVALVVAKLTFRVATNGEAKVVPSNIRLDDEPDEHRGLRYAHDVAEEKVGTDVTLIGTAYPRGRVSSMAVWLQIGGYRKVTNVYGKRRYVQKGSGIAPGPSETLEPTPIVHALAWGGTDDTVAARPYEARNPVGRGFAAEPSSLIGAPAHVLEPSAQSTLPPGHESHACHAAFAPLPFDWEPRRSRAGTYDGEWQRERAPARPLDFDPLFNSFATPDLHFQQTIGSDAPIEVGGMTPEGVWRFKLPRYELSFASETGPEKREIATHLDALMIDAENATVELTWRAAVRLPRKWDTLRRIEVWGTPLADELFDDLPREEIPA